MFGAFDVLYHNTHKIGEKMFPLPMCMQHAGLSGLTLTKKCSILA